MTFAIDDTRIPKRIRQRLSVAESGCWEFTGTRSAGYGMTTVGGKRKRVHRVVWEALVEPIEEGLVIDHLCRNTPCCNPEHLEPVTSGENVLRGEGASALNARKTHCTNGHELTESNCLKEYLPHRHCKACYIDWITRKARYRGPGVVDDDDWLYLDYDE
jgi:hypothetical protein